MSEDSCSDLLLSAQRNLRDELLAKASVVSWAPARDLVAQLLLYLDDTDACWEMSVNWLQRNFDADRVEGSSIKFGSDRYELGLVEARKEGEDIPSVNGLSIPSSSLVLRTLSAQSRPYVFTDVSQSVLMDKILIQGLVNRGTRGKVSAAIGYGGNTIGFICLDSVYKPFKLTAQNFERFEMVTGAVLSRILSASAQLVGRNFVDEAVSVSLRNLSPAERKILSLLVRGLSYKQIASKVNRSIHTVDHQLRSIRAKLKVNSNIQLCGIFSAIPGDNDYTKKMSHAAEISQ